MIVSIHAPPRGTRIFPPPETRTGEHVSIHAPRGRDFQTHRPAPDSRFQSTRPRGARLRHRVQRGAGRFQSTRPRGARPPRPSRRSKARCFNPRAPGGRDGVLSLSRLWLPVSIHAPPGARRDLLALVDKQAVSIHAPPRGATPPAPLRLRLAQFQSTRPRGARLQRRQRDQVAVALGVMLHASTSQMSSTISTPGGKSLRFTPTR